ncbi:Sugp1, partial [Symbiodinium microadriaticum]
ERSSATPFAGGDGVGNESLPAAASRREELTDDEVAVVMKTALWVASNEDKLNALIHNSKDNAKLKFLNEPRSAAGQLFSQELDKLRTQRKVRDICGDDETATTMLGGAFPVTPATMDSAYQSSVVQSSRVFSREDMQKAGREAALLAMTQSRKTNASSGTFSTSGTVVPGNGQSTATVSSSTDAVKERRRNRWGPALTPAPLSGISGELLSAQLPSQSVTPPVVDARMAAQIREQKELQLIEQRIREAARLQSLMKSAQDEDGALDDPSSSYNQLRTLQGDLLNHYAELAARDDGSRDTVEDAEQSMGVIDGGSWEHRKRAKEMLATAVKNQELTLATRNKHHISQFLPQAEHDKFLQKKGPTSDFSDHKLTEDNIGFQILEKAGWNPGSGLGSEGTASTLEPVSVLGAAQRPDGAGVGTSSTHSAEDNDDEFDSYRKRMMLSYRFRPNPLNNPRRDYY